MLVLLVSLTCLFFVWSANPVHGVLTLVLVGLGFSGILLTQALEFTALIIVLVYVGAVTVLFIFVVIIVNLRATPVSYLTAEAVPIWLVLAAILGGSTWGVTPPAAVTVLLSPGEGNTNLVTLGGLLYSTERLYAVFLVGLVLFIAMVAAICLSLVGGENYRTQEFYSQIRRSNGVFVFSKSPKLTTRL